MRKIWLVLSLVTALPFLTLAQTDDGKVNDFQLVGIAQDLFRQQGFDVPRGSMKIQDVAGWGRVLYITLKSRRTTQMDDILTAFVVGGGINPYANAALDYIVVISEVNFKDDEQLVLAASAKCSEQLFYDQVDVDYFSDKCLITE